MLMYRPPVFPAIAIALTFFVASCGNDPTAPDVPDEPEGPGEGAEADIPEIPKPTSASSDTPMQSEILEVVALNKADFVGTVTSGVADWELHRRGRACGWPAGFIWDPDPDIIVTANAHHSSNLVFFGKGLQANGYIKPWRVVWMEGGEFVDPRYGGEPGGGWDNTVERVGLGFNSWDGVPNPGCGGLLDIGNLFPWEFYWILDCPRMTSPVYIKRERFWSRVPVDGGGAMFARLDGEGTSFEIETSYTRGVNETNTMAYARTVSVGVDGGATTPVVSLTTAVEESIEFSFSTEVEVSLEESVAYTQGVEGRAGKIVIFMLWELVERYSVVDAEGNPYTDPSFEFDPNSGAAEVRGVALALDATEFDAP
ncbi:MAG: hypothetical protein HKN12_11450 [Gemmatimonadetes bacterium]|nr:hypothetical protein [Gemmatimonadota bacterium]